MVEASVLKLLFPSAEAWVQALGENSHLNSVLLLRDCVGERLRFEVAFRQESCKLAKTPSFGFKIPLQCVLVLGELKHQGFIDFWVEEWVFYNFVIVRGAAHGEDYELEFCWGTCSQAWQGKRWLWC